MASIVLPGTFDGIAPINRLDGRQQPDQPDQLPELEALGGGGSSLDDRGGYMFFLETDHEICPREVQRREVLTPVLR